MKIGKSCLNCIHINRCLKWEMSEDEDEVTAKDCERFEFMDTDEYIPSATGGDYSPSNPWDAPGMSIRDFI